MAQTDRTTGLVGNAGMKVPVRAASTANVTLSGEQTIDGVALVTDDRVLLKDQTDGTENGIWVVDTGSWSRAKDCDGVYDLVKGSLIRVNEGDTHAGGIFACSTADPITIGSSSLSFARIEIVFVTRDSQVASAAQTAFTVPAYQLAANSIQVFVNGLRMRVDDDYTETDTTHITFTYGLQSGDQVDFYIGVSIGTLTAAAASQVAVTDAGDYYVSSTLESVLQELATGVTADVGDADVTLTNASSARIARYNTALTANRAVTLATANAKEGAKFWVVRGSGATGNFTLDVGGLATLRAPGEYCMVAYDAGTAAWVLVQWGILPSAEVRALSADNGDADATLTIGSSALIQRWATALTAQRTATLASTRAHSGARFIVVRTEDATGNFALLVTDGTTDFARLAPGQWAELVNTGAGWILLRVGNLRNRNTQVVELYDDFVGYEISGYLWQSVIGTDAACLQATVNADQAGGVVRLTTGADAGATMALNGAQVQSHLNWRADKGCLVWEARVAIDAITNVCLFIGLTDQRTALEMPFTLSAGDVLTSNATDAVGVLFDTAADTDKWWLVGVAADVDATKQNSALAPVAGTFETWRIEVNDSGAAKFYRNNTLIGTAMAGAVTPSVLLTPVVAAFSRGAASRNVDIDEILVQAQR